LADDLKRQTELSLTLAAGGGESLKLVRIDAYEALSQPFSISLDVVTRGDLELLPNLGVAASVTSSIDGETMRHYHGIVTDGTFVEDVQNGYQLYRLTLSPLTWFHEQGSNFRIFQGKTVVQIIQAVLEGAGIEHRIEAAQGRKLAYCVQYGESDFAFVSRLMEEEGIYYYYQHAEAAHTLVICDGTREHPALGYETLRFNPATDSVVLTDSKVRFAGFQQPFVQHWQERASSGAEARVTMRDYDFQNSRRTVETVAADERLHGFDEIEVYRWPGRYFEPGEGETLARVLLESRRAQRLRYEGTSRYAGFQAGFTFSLARHPHERFNRKYMVVACRSHMAAEHYASGMEGSESEVDFTAIPNDVPFRAPLVTPRPVTRGPETAVVTGPPEEEIHVDKFGRIKVQFHWDREGKLDDTSSCWIRVSQTGGLGNIIIPRVGHEVLVDFINGNPDRPIVVGRVFNDEHMPVYDLPENKTKALWRSKTYKRDSGEALSDAVGLDTGKPGANELRFEDKTGGEEVFLHAEKDMNTRIRNCETHHVGKDVEIQVGHNRTETVGDNEKIEIGADREEKVGGTETVTVTGDRTVTIQSNDKLDVAQALSVQAGTTIEIKANTSITLQVGSSKIVIDQASIKAIATAVLDLKGQATATLSSPMTQIEGSGLLVEKGGLVMIN
jgi:type VI secretion system secreted protein VgrG